MANVSKLKSAPFKWTPQRERAAALLAEDRLSDEKIARDIGLNQRTSLWEWKQHPDFLARIDQINADYASTIGRLAITQRARRLTALNDRWRRMQDLVEAREEAYVPELGGDALREQVRHTRDRTGRDTGLVVEKPGEFGVEYAFDAALMNEMLKAEKQAAQEMGQWVEKLAPTTPNGEAAYEPIDLTRLSADDLRALHHLAEKAVVAPGD